MTKSELFELGDKILNSNNLKRLNKCQAWYTEAEIPNTIYHLHVLRSYSTCVAVFSSMNNTLYVRDYYSHTTVQHVNAFLKHLQCHGYTKIAVIYLYRRSDAIIRTVFKEVSNSRYTYLGRLFSERLVLETYENLEREDFDRLVTIDAEPIPTGGTQI